MGIFCMYLFLLLYRFWGLWGNTYIFGWLRMGFGNKEFSPNFSIIYKT